MRNLLYPKLAFTNIRKNSKTYIPYILTGTFTVAMYYIIYSIVHNEGIDKMPGAGNLRDVIGVGIAIVAIFSCIFLFYTNSFLMKQRKKELGLYNVLGLGKRHIAKMMFLETLMIALFDIIVGLLFGMVFSKLMFLLLLKIGRIDAPLVYMIEPTAIVMTTTLFGTIFAATLLYNMWQVFRVNTVELLHSKNQGEKEPKTKWFLAIFGLIALTAGYVIAIIVEQPLQALTAFFFAVIFVIIGTYALFTAGSIAVLKMLRNNKTYYYKTSHFISVSGMIYRMKQNAAGLANICILSTMVLVMVSTTVSLYSGMDNILKTRFPYEFNANAREASAEQVKEFRDEVREGAKEKGIPIKQERVYQSIDIIVSSEGRNKLQIVEGSGYDMISSAAILSVVPISWYNGMFDDDIVLQSDEALFYSPLKNKTIDLKKGELLIGDNRFQITGSITEFASSGQEAMNALDTMYLFVDDETILGDFGKNVAEIQEGVDVGTTIGYNFKGNKKEESEMTKWVEEVLVESGMNAHVEIRENYRGEFYSFYGGFLFLGIFFGSLFLMATVLIIYYKQISEGYDDKERFQIMQKVGMSKREVRKTIRSQVVSVFALPLLTAILHICVAFKVISRLLVVMNLTDVALFRRCTILSIGVFAIAYVAVYFITAREYYKIIN